MRIKDGDWWLVDHDVKMGRTVWAMSNPDGSTTYRTDYSVDPIVEVNQAQRNLAQPGWKGDYHMVASIPVGIYYDRLAEAQKQGDSRYVDKWLNDSDNRAWRTKTGRV